MLSAISFAQNSGCRSFGNTNHLYYARSLSSRYESMLLLPVKIRSMCKIFHASEFVLMSKACDLCRKTESCQNDNAMGFTCTNSTVDM